jgi:hypothetical protein
MNAEQQVMEDSSEINNLKRQLLTLSATLSLKMKELEDKDKR